MSERNPEVDRMKRLLHTRVRRRKYEGGHHFQLDMRHGGLRGGRVAVRDPSNPDWPEKGGVARTKGQALEWVDAYVHRLGLEWCRGKVVLRSVKEHGEAYLEELGNTKGRDSSKYRNHKNYLRNHVYPKLGKQRLRALGGRQLQALVDGVRTLEGQPAGISLRRGVLAALNNVWRQAFPRYPLPWAREITIEGKDLNRARRERAKAGIRLSEQQGGFTPDELRWILIVALAVDLHGARNPRKRRGVNNHADLIAFLIHHMVRIEEATFLRKKDVNLDLNCILVSGTKTQAAEERLIPTPEGLRALARPAPGAD